MVHALSWLSAGYLVLLVGGRYFSPGSVQRHHLESASFIFVAATLASVSGAVIAIVSGLCVAASRWSRNSRAFHRVLLMSRFVPASIAAVNAIFFVSDDLLGSVISLSRRR